MDHDERRRFFRIDDMVALHYEVMSDQVALEKAAWLKEQRLGPGDRMQDSEKELQMLIDKLRVQHPEFARAVELLNVKFNILKDTRPDVAGDRYGSNQIVQEVSISACGISFTDELVMPPGRKVYLDITLLPSDLHVRTMSEVIEGGPDADNPGLYSKRLDYVELDPEDEELLVQHLVKRQGRLIGKQKLAEQFDD